jgi:hypothetical protein
MSRRFTTSPTNRPEQVTQALLGEPLTVEEQQGGWVRVRTAYDYPGWIRDDALTPVPGTVPGRWLPEPRLDGDPVEEARAYLGTPYLWGGMTERGIAAPALSTWPTGASGVSFRETPTSRRRRACRSATTSYAAAT